MKFKTFKTLMLILVLGVFSVLGFSACKNPRDGLTLSLESQQIQTDESGNKYINLVKDEDNAESGIATVDVKVLNGDDSLVRTVSAKSSATNKVTASVVFNKQTQVSTITIRAVGGTASNRSTFITIFSDEDSNVSETIYINITQRATGMDYTSSFDVTRADGSGQPDTINNLAVFYGVPFVFQTEKLFQFTPKNSLSVNMGFITSLTNQQEFKNGETLTIPTTSSTEIVVNTYDIDNPTDTTFQKTFKLKLLTPLTEESFALSRTDTLETDISKIDLITNYTAAENNANVRISTTDAAVTANLKYELVSDERYVIARNNPEYPNNFTLYGNAENSQGTQVMFNISYEGISNSMVITKTIDVRVVNYPKKIFVNDQDSIYKEVGAQQARQDYINKFIKIDDGYVLVEAGNIQSLVDNQNLIIGTTIAYIEQQYELVVFDEYAAGGGAKLVVDLDKVSEGFGEFELSTDTPIVAKNLTIKLGENIYSLAQEVNGTYEAQTLTFNSGDKLVLTAETNTSGFLELLITAKNNIRDNTLSRKIRISFVTGISTINILNIENNKLSLEYDENGRQIDTNTKDVVFGVSPHAATLFGVNGCYVSASSSNINVVSVGGVTKRDDGNAQFTLTSQGVGQAVITLVSLNGRSEKITVNVLPHIETLTIGVRAIEESNDTEILYKPDITDSTKQTLKSITTTNNKTFTFYVKDYPEGSDNYVKKSINFYLGELNEETGNVNRKTLFTSENGEILSNIIAISGSSLRTSFANVGKVYIVAQMEFYALDPNTGTAKDVKTIEQDFSVEVYQPIENIVVSTNNVTLLNKDVTADYYNKAMQSATLTVNTTNKSTITASEAVWRFKTPSGSDYVTLSPSGTSVLGGNNTIIGSEVLIKSGSLGLGENNREIELEVSLKDVREKIFSETITIRITRQTFMGVVRIGSYDEDEGIYFETKRRVSTLPTDENGNLLDRLANLEYDEVYQSKDLNISVKQTSTPTNSNLEYLLFDCDENFSTQTATRSTNNYSSKSIWLGYNSSNKKYFVTPLNAGYSILVVIPQDRLKNESSKTTWSDIATVTNKIVIKISVADGITTFFRLYDAEGILDVSNNPDSWDKNYYVMQDIDVSGVSANLGVIGTEEIPFTGQIMSYEGSTKTIYGFNITQNGSVFGVVGETGVIKNVNFHITNITATGAVAGFIIKMSKGATLEGVGVEIENMDINSNMSSINIGTIAENNSSNYKGNINISINAKVLSTNTAQINFGGFTGLNKANLSGNGFAKFSVATNFTADYDNCLENADLGGAVGESEAGFEITNFTTTGKIETTAKSGAGYAGGVVGKVRGDMENCVSSVRILNAKFVGGIAGISIAKILNCSYQIFETEKVSLYSEAKDATVGGIVAQLNNGGSVVNSYAVCFVDISQSNTPNIQTTNIAGGVVGSVFSNTSSVSKCYFTGIITGNIIGGLVGSLLSNASINISNCFVSGKMMETNTDTSGLFVGEVKGGNVSATTSYSILTSNTPLQLCGSYKGSYNNVYAQSYVDEKKPDNNVVYKDLFNENKANYQNTYANFDFSSDWAAPSETTFGYPIPKANGKAIYPVIPNKISLATKGGIGVFNAYQITNSKRIVIVYDNLPASKINLTSLFDILAPNNLPEEVLINITSSNTACVKVSGTTLADAALEIISSGASATIIISSKYNSSVFEIIGVQVVQGYSDLKLYLSEDDKETEEDGSSNNIVEGDTVAIQKDVTNEWFINYQNTKLVINEGGQQDYITTNLSANNLGSGISFVMEEGFAEFLEDVLKNIQVSKGAILKDFVLRFKTGSTYNLEAMENALSTLLGKTCKASTAESIISLSVNGILFASINTSTQEITNDEIITVNRKNILSFIQQNILYGTKIYTIKLADFGENEILFSDINNFLSLFYQNTNVYITKLAGVDYLIYQVDGYTYARISQIKVNQTFNLKTEIYASVENTNIAKIKGLLSGETQVLVVPYFKGTFNKTNAKEILSTQETSIAYNYQKQFMFNLVVYQGAYNLSIPTGGTEENPAEFEVSQEINFDITLESDAQLDKQNGVLVSIYEDDQLIIERVIQLNESNEYLSRVVNRSTLADKYLLVLSSPSVEGNIITQNLSFKVIESEKVNFNIEKTIKIVVSNKEYVAGSNVLEKTAYFTYLPQLVQNIELTHYADAKLEGESGTAPGNFLTNAGAIPSNNILTGEMGLLKINISPYFSQFDKIIVSSNVVNGDRVSFQQRVVGTQVVNGVLETRYYFYSGATYTSDGIEVNPITNQDGTFNGTIWLQTLIAKQSTSAASFIVTVTIKKEGQPDYIKNFELLVDSSSNIIVGYPNMLDANTTSPKAFIAVGTGGVNETQVNQNALTIRQIGVFESQPSVKLLNDTTTGKVKIENINGSYYIVAASDCEVGKTFDVQVQGVKYVNGYRRTITRTINFTTVDFVLGTGSLTIDGLTDNMFDKPYYKNAYHKLTINYNLNNININTNISSSVENLGKLIKNFNNGKLYYNNEYISVWSFIDAENNIKNIMPSGLGEFDFVYAETEKLTDEVEMLSEANKTNKNTYTIIDDSYYLRLITGSAEQNGWYICPVKQSTRNSSIVFNAQDFLYNNGNLEIVAGISETRFTVPQLSVDVRFSQQTSLDSPIPIENLNDLLAMEEGKDYRLMTNINIINAWVPITTNISSLDGNGHTITISGFNTTNDVITQVSGSYGLFAIVSENTFLKNITVCFENNINLVLTNLDAISFGGIAGTNNGTITNCVVEAYGNYVTVENTNELATNYVSGLVGTNNASISNSRVCNIRLTASGYVSGVVSLNTGHIASSFANNIIITNLASSNLNGATAGFVSQNKGTILTSYVGGTYVREQDDEINIEEAVGEKGRTAQIVSSVNAGGFVFENTGAIFDCFAGVTLSVDANMLGAVSGGFAYSNLTGGSIARCYSTSYAPQRNKAHTPFIGPKIDPENDSLYSLNLDNESNIVDCFYLDIGFGANGVELSTKAGIKSLSVEQFINEDNNQIEFWKNYSTSKVRTKGFDKGEELTGVWTFINTDNVLFNIKHYYKNLSTNNNLFVLGPRLVSADTILTENWESVEYNTNTKIYTYSRGADEYGNSITNYARLDETNNNVVVSPNLIDSAERLYITMQNDLKDDGIINEWYRLVCDIDLSELTPLGLDIAILNTATFAGNLDGNGFTILGLDISSGVVDSFGLFAKIDGKLKRQNNYAAVENLNINITDVAAARANKVGALAGEAQDVVLANINVSAKSTSVIMIGNNIIGGVVGKLYGNSRASNIESSVSVSAVFGEKQTTNLLYNVDLLRIYNLHNITSYVNKDQQLCYSGGVFGIVDLTSFSENKIIILKDDYNDARIFGIKTTGESKVIGTTSGGVIGLLGASSFAENIKKIAENGSYIKASRYAGGIVGENHGYLNYAQLTYTKEVQNRIDTSTYVGEVVAEANFDLFKDRSKAIGGIVGLNVGYIFDLQSGIVENSFSKVDVRNTLARVAGGIAGISIGGDFDSCYTTSSVLTARTGTVGGAFGSVCSIVDIIDDVKDPLYSVPNKSFYSGMDDTKVYTTVNRIVAANNWRYSDYEDIQKIVTSGGNVGGFAGKILHSKISVNHASLLNEEYEALVEAGKGILYSAERNFYVKEIYNTQPLKKSKQSVGYGLQAVAEGDGLDVATGLTRFDMFNYSYTNNKTNSDENKQVDRMFESWNIYDYGKVISEYENENGNIVKTYKIIDYDENEKPIYNPQEYPDIIEIWTVNDFQQMRDAPTLDYVLMADIDFSGVDYIPIGTASKPFRGTFSGKSKDKALNKEITHTLYNITMPVDSTYSSAGIGLFAFTSGATLSDFVVCGINLSSASTAANNTSFASLLVGYAEETNIENVHVLESVERQEGKVLNNKFTLAGDKEVNINSKSDYGNNFTKDGKKYEFRTTGSETYVYQTWKGSNKLQTSANYVGGAVGQISVLIKDKVSLSNISIEAQITSVPSVEFVITPNTTTGRFVLGGELYVYQNGIIEDVNGNLIATISGGTFTLGNYQITVDGSSFVCKLVIFPENYFGGVVGYASVANNSKIDLKRSYFDGNITISKDAPLYVGGIAGEANNLYATDVFSRADITIQGTSGNIYVGGFAGELETSNLFNTMAMGDININVKSSKKDVYVGGFVGHASGSIKNAVTGTNINFNSQKDNWLVLSNALNTQMIGGFAGSIGTDVNKIEIENAVSYATIKNNSILGNVAGFVFEAPTDFQSTNNKFTNAYFDSYLALTSQDIYNTQRKTNALMQTGVFSEVNGVSLNCGNSKYPTLSITISGANDVFYDKYQSLYALNVLQNNKGTKIMPIQITSASGLKDINTQNLDWTKNSYKYYLQKQNITNVSLTGNLNLQGFYNAAGYMITTTSYDGVYGATLNAQKIGVFSEIASKGVVSGLVVNINVNVKLTNENIKEERASIGSIASKIGQYSIIFASGSKGLISVKGTNYSENIIGGLVAENSGQILSSSSNVKIYYASNKEKQYAIGGLIGVAAQATQGYSLKECYFNGEVKVASQETQTAYAGGLIGKIVQNTTHTLVTSDIATANTANCYVSANMVGNCGMLFGGAASGNCYKNVYYIESDKPEVQKSSDEIGTIFDVSAQRLNSDKHLQTSYNTYNYNIINGIRNINGYTSSMTRSAWKTFANYNYGLPILSHEGQSYYSATGDGTVSNPYKINSENQLVWALVAGDSYYELTKDLNYEKINLLKQKLNMDNKIIFSGNLIGQGHYIENSTNSLVDINAGNISSLGFKNSQIQTGLVTTKNGGILEAIYCDASGEQELFVGENIGAGCVINSLTKTCAYDKNGDKQAINNYSYNNILTNEKFDFIKIWTLQTNTPSSTDGFENGNLMLRVFVESIENLNIDKVDGDASDNEERNIYNITTKEQYSAVLQYLTRNIKDLQITLNIKNDINMEGIKLKDLIGGNENAVVTINGFDKTIYNFMLDNVKDSKKPVGMFGTLKGTLKALNFNQVNFITLSSGGIIAGKNTGHIQDVNISNSILIGTNLDVKMGAVSAENTGRITGVRMNNVSIISCGGMIGGVTAENAGEISVVGISDLKITQIQENVSKIGGITALINKKSTINILGNVNVSISGNLAAVESIGGIAGASNTSEDVQITNTSLITLNITAEENKNIGGAVGSNLGSGSLTIITSDGSSVGRFNVHIEGGKNINIGGIIGEALVNTSKIKIIDKNSSYTSVGISIVIDGTENENIGGIIGQNWAEIENLYVDATNISLSINDSNKNVGIIAGLNEGTINNATVKKANLKSKGTNIGIISGTNKGVILGSVTDCSIGSSNDGTASYAGLFAGLNNSEIKTANIINSKVYANEYVGGITGFNESRIGELQSKSSISKLSVYGNTNVGVVTSINKGFIYNIVITDSTITSNNQGSYGFVVQENLGTISGIIIKGSGCNLTISSNSLENVGILAGINNGRVQDSSVSNFNLAAQNATNIGFIGTNNSTVINIESENVVISNGKNVGLIVGFNASSGTVQNAVVSFDEGTFNFNNITNFGFVVGLNEGTISGANVSGKLKETNKDPDSGETSGETGEGTGSTETGGTTGTGGEAGGETTPTQPTIIYTILTIINITNITNFGGVVGYNNGTISGSINVSNLNISGGNNVGGVIGNNNSSVTVGNTTVSRLDINGTTVGGYAGVNNGRLTLQKPQNQIVINCTIPNNQFVGSGGID